jgi:nucleoside-diphosphate-sugar epimerase
MKMLDGPRVLLTGGAGFLGCHLCEKLVGAGAEVLCMDDFYTGTRANVDGPLELMSTADQITGPINLGNDSEFTIRQLAETVIELNNSGSKIITNPLPSDDPRQRKPDIALARETLGWSATTPLSIGLRKAVSYFDGLLKSDRHASIPSL